MPSPGKRANNVHNMTRCARCGHCWRVCPENAIEFQHLLENDWDNVIEVNLKGYFIYNKLAAAQFKEQRSGKIVNITSINGLRGKFGQCNYSASKGGIISLTKALAKEVGKFNVNVIAKKNIEDPKLPSKMNNFLFPNLFERTAVSIPINK